MPRRPKFNHPVRVIRTSVKLTQEKFAAEMGLSASALQAIELGKRRAKQGIDPLLAARIAVRFGAKPGTFERPDLVPLDLTGRPYSCFSPARLEKLAATEKATGLESRRRQLILEFVDLLLRAAGTEKCFEACRWSLATWAEQVMRDYQLEDAHCETYLSVDPLDGAGGNSRKRRTGNLQEKSAGAAVPKEEKRALAGPDDSVADGNAHPARLDPAPAPRNRSLKTYRQMYRSVLTRDNVKVRATV